MNNRQMLIVIVIAAIGILISSSLFTVSERELAIKFRLGEIVKSDYEPGLYLQIPFVNNVKKYESCILTLDTRATEYLTKEKKKLIVDFFAKWRVNNVEKYYRTMSRGNINTARQRIFNIINDGLKSQFSKYELSEMVSGKQRKAKNSEVNKDVKQVDIRAVVMENITKQANAQVEKYGISIVDIRIKRIDLTTKISKDVYRRMQSERQQFAADIRAQGREAAERLKAGADRQRTIILANAYQMAQSLRGNGDAKASEIYANAYNKDPEFYSFYRSLTAYKKSFSGNGDLMVLEPTSDFFKYFKKSK
ncbi:MAG: protease modulator HflC [Candidatus Heimdallarchaeota archaeon]|nr:protease modulator HflC [Candidatus Heimdallarchaeota archaeon]